MKNFWSFLVCILIGLVLLQTRYAIPGPGKEIKVTTWDAFGYYMYLPATLIYHDYKKLHWLDSIDRKYQVTGGNGWQAVKLEDGNYTFKYLGGVALMELPLFAVGHCIALATHYPTDGFSAPYQYALAYGVLVYCLLALFLLRHLLRRFFSDPVTATTLLLLTLATNYVQYAAVDNAQSHVYIFVLYVLILYTTAQWHQRPRSVVAFFIGYIIGLATMSRPTEAIMLLIPLLWQTQNKASAREKWKLVRRHRTQVWIALAGGFLGILPQLIYWKLSTGSFIYDVGSKWVFLNPYVRVLFGWEKGWFIYTPVTVLFVLGLFFIRRYPFKNSVLWFCLFNLWIIMAWSDWRYGASYSTRALVQSYPVFALPLAALTEKLSHFKRLRFFLLLAGIYLIAVNIFQVYQYNKTILHYDDMNRNYYARIYLNPDPTPEDVSLLDNNPLPPANQLTKGKTIVTLENKNIQFTTSDPGIIADTVLTHAASLTWLKVEATIQTTNPWKSFLRVQLQTKDSVLDQGVRLFSPLNKPGAPNRYAFYVSVPSSYDTIRVRIFLKASSDFQGTIKTLTLTGYR